MHPNRRLCIPRLHHSNSYSHPCPAGMQGLRSAPDCRVAALASACDRARAASSAARPSLRTALMKTSMSTGVAVGLDCSRDNKFSTWRTLCR